MAELIRQKHEQAEALVAESGFDVWLTFVRETSGGGDPVLPFLLDGGLTWISALMVSRAGERIAVVGNYDADPLIASGHWTKVVPYVQSIREPLLNELERICGERPRIAANYSTDDVKSDGLTHGMYLLLRSLLAGTRFDDALVSAEDVTMRLRGQKTDEEIRRLRRAIDETERLFVEASDLMRVGVTERAIYDRIQTKMDAHGFGYGWDRAGNPIVNTGPDSMIGHGVPSSTLTIQPGHLVHIDLGVVTEGYSSDIQRCWYMPEPGETSLPEDVARGLEAVNAAIGAGAAHLKPGVEGWVVDAAARATLVGYGYDEYLHALGHQVGRMAHDGGAILGPRWERYGRTPDLPVREREVYTLELGVTLPRRGYLGIEEMVVVTDDGCEFLTSRQLSIPLLRPT